MERRKFEERSNPETPVREKPMLDSGLPKGDDKTYMGGGFYRKFYRDLGARNNIQVAANPLSEISRTSVPYAVINDNNPIIDARYPEDPNTTGNILVQIARGSQSTLQSVVDDYELSYNINYDYCKLNATSNASAAVNSQMNNIWEEVKAKLSAEAFYQIPFFSWEVSGNTMFQDPLLDITMFYQTVCQTVMLIPTVYKKMRSFEQTLKDMMFYENSSRMERLYNELNKTTFSGLVQAVAKSVSSDYVDGDWTNQVTMIFLNPSRKFNGMLSPLIDAKVKYNWNNNLQVSYGGKNIIDTSTYSSFFQAAEDFINKCSIMEFLYVARNVDLKNSAGKPFEINKDFFNVMKTDLNTMIDQLVIFNDQFNDMNVAFKGMERLQLTKWRSGLYVSLDKLVNNFSPKYNIMLHDIMQATMSGSSDITYNQNTYKWQLYDVMDIYTDIPRYTKYAGGAPITFSLKNVVSTGAPANIMYPALMQFVTSTALTRSGKKVVITPVTTSLAGSVALQRLNSMANVTPTMKAPSFNIGTANLTVYEQSWVTRFLSQEIGYYSTTNPVQQGVDPDKMFLVDIEQDDVTNLMLDYVRQNAPFRTIVPSLEQKLGFIIPTRAKESVPHA